MASLKLPQEVIDLIIGNVGQSSLKACSLVSKAFLPRSRRLMFRVLKLHQDQRETLVDRLEVLQLLLANDPQIARQVNVLHLTDGSGTLSEASDNGYHWITYERRLPAILRTLNHVNHIILCGRKSRVIDWTRLSLPLRSALLSILQSQNLSHVELSHIRGLPVTKFGASDGLARMSMQHVYFDQPLVITIRPHSSVAPDRTKM